MKQLSLLPLFLLAFSGPTFAQVVSDDTVSTTVNPLENNQFEITGGEQAGNNLFHSFEQFSVPKNGSIHFLNTAIIKNIITRVTGNHPSHIQGTITTEGTANLILLNPNGITFGENAKLQIGGSFLGTTAQRIQFADGTVYDTTDPTSDPLLTVTAPIGLGFGATPADIINKAGRFGQLDALLEPLQVPTGETFALVGGNILLQGGLIEAPAGQVELGAVAGENQVGITETETGWKLNYDQVTAFANIELLNDSSLSASDPGDAGNDSLATRGSIQLQGKEIRLENNSTLGIDNNDRFPSEVIFLGATDAVMLREGSTISSTTFFGNGRAGNILIETPTLILLDSSRIVANTILSEGRGGNIIINAEDTVKLDGVSVISTETFGEASIAEGDAGDINIKAGNLQLTNGGRIVSSVRDGSSGDGGTINIEITESLEINGSEVNQFTQETQFSRIASESVTRPPRLGQAALTTGNAGTVNISTPHLTLSDGGQISVATLRKAQGKAGSLRINADNLLITGENSGIFASSVSPQDAGNLTIEANSVRLQQGGEISATATGTGEAGNVNISTNFLQLQQGNISADTQTGKGNITLTTRDLRLRDNSNIRTNAFGFADGGNITVNTDTVTLLEASQINANAQQGFGGRVVINTQGIFLAPNTAITATSERGEAFNGVVEINTPDDQGTLAFIFRDQSSASLEIYQECVAGNSISEFIVSGRGGVSPTSRDIRQNTTLQADLALPRPIVEARGWVKNEQGETVLTAHSPFAFQSACLPKYHGFKAPPWRSVLI